MNIENFSTINLPGLADLGDTKNWASIKGDDPGPKGPIGSVGYSATSVGREILLLLPQLESVLIVSL